MQGLVAAAAAGIVLFAARLVFLCAVPTPMFESSGLD
jgi:hypothetical protein